jgi:hypothetical protein
MMQIKSHKSVGQIAKKHRMNVSDIQKQLDMGVPIEHEHTRDKVLATDIALQHLDEIPDYYTRLKKMEASAKKEHRKFKDVKEDAVTDLQRGIVELPDASYHSIDNLMRRIMKKRKMSAKQLHNDFVDKHNQTPDSWAKKNMKEETKSGDQGLRDWFGKSESKDKKPGWVNVVTGGTCASDEPGEGVPKCVSSQRRANMSKEERLSASRRKKEADPGQQEKSGAAKPTNVRTEEMNLQEVKDKAGKNSGKKDACYNKVKSRYDVWPSAYASGALVKCRKVGVANWGTKSEACWDGYEAKGMKKKGKKMVPNCVPVNSESTDSLDYTWNTPIRERADRYCPKCEKLETRSECKYGTKYWDMFSLPAELISSKKDYNITMPHPANEEKDHEYSMARSEISTIIGAAKRLKKKMGKGEGNLEAWVQSKITKAADYLDAAADYIDSRESKVNEDTTIEDANGNTFLRIIDIIKADRLVREGISPSIPGGKSPYKNPSLPEENPDDVKIRIIKGKEPQLPLAKGEGGSPYEPYKAPKEDPKNPYVPAPKRPNVQLAHYESEGTYIEEQVSDTDTAQEKFDRRVNAAKAPGLTPALKVKILKSASEIHPSKTLESFMIEASAAWQRKEGKNPEGGLNKKGIASYRKENPGSRLSLAVTTEPSKLKPGSKKANRRKSFCSRMSGMKKKLTSAKTANDPNSRINKSLRKWNC